ncbi:MAG: bifunctional oligoribonuclease/PAP phosphatase NrnA [Clostridia bacterium]|nr:bifunctional oligoribonuclease/PAP phosphatase NrnA [Clostridia bacterium]
MSELKQIKEKLLDAKHVAIYTHINPDGDALGSAFASKAVLEALGIPATVWLEQPLPEKYEYLNSGYSVWEEDKEPDADTALAVDCGAEGRLGKLASFYMSAKTKLCIDHHLSNHPFGDVYYCRPEAAATAELIYGLAKEMLGEEFPMAVKIGIYTGLSTDTGHFKYSNVTEHTFLVAADLIRQGMDARAITRHLYDTVKLEKLRFMGAAAERVERYADGKLAVLCAFDAFLEEYGIVHEDVEELPNMPMGLDGVLVAVLVKDHVEKGYKYSLRGRELIDLSELATHFGGGGHKNAAAFVSELPMEEVIKTLIKLIEERLHYV